MTLNVLAWLFVGVLGRIVAGQMYSGAGGSCPLLPATPSNLRVFAISSPFFTPVNSTTGTKNTGFLADLLDGFQQKTGLTYTLTARTDLNYGDKNAGGSFNGSLIGTLINNEADLVGADIFILAEQETVVDFLIPFTQYKIEILANAQFGLNNGVQYVILDQVGMNLVCAAQTAMAQTVCTRLRSGLPASIVASDQEGIEKVLSGNFAFVEGSPVINEAIAANPGKFTDGGSILDIFVGLAVQQGSPLREILNIAFLQLEEDGTIQALFNKYNIKT